MFKQVSKQQVHGNAENIAQQLEELILEGSLKAGDRMPSERQLAGRLGVSRPLIREAFKALQGRGVIKTVHGKGSFVTGAMQLSEGETALGKMYSQNPAMLYDLLEVRAVLEGQAAHLAATRATEKDLYFISKAFKAMNAAIPQTHNRVFIAELDHAFHRSIYEASHNPVLIHTLQNLMQLMLDSVMVSVDNLYHRANAKSCIDDYHRLIYNAIMDRKPQSAEHAAMDHVRDIGTRIREIEREEQRVVRAQAIMEPE